MKSIISMLLLVSMTIFSQEIIIDKNILTKKAHTIELHMRKDRYIKYGLTTCGIIRELCQWTVMIKNVLGLYNNQIKTEEKPTMKEALQALFTYIFYTKEGWGDLVFYFSSRIGEVAIDQLNERFSHPDTLRWYVHSQAPIMQTLVLMEKELLKMNLSVLNQEQLNQSQARLEMLYEQLVHHAEIMCAYSMYKIKVLEPQDREKAKKITDLMISMHNQRLKSIKDDLYPSNHYFSALDSLIASYKDDIRTYINHFALVEGELLHEKIFVTKIIKKISLFNNNSL